MNKMRQKIHGYGTRVTEKLLKPLSYRAPYTCEFSGIDPSVTWLKDMQGQLDRALTGLETLLLYQRPACPSKVQPPTGVETPHSSGNYRNSGKSRYANKNHRCKHHQQNTREDRVEDTVGKNWYTGKWIELEELILIEVTQTQKDKHGIYSL
ncbi:hypothetical protein STEG23_034948, partial [Scotinomys teguina]